MSVTREYQCNNPDCGDGTKFVVTHSDKISRQKICSWCGKKVEETGKYWLVWRKNVIGYNKDGSKFEVYLRRDLKRLAKNKLKE